MNCHVPSVSYKQQQRSKIVAFTHFIFWVPAKACQVKDVNLHSLRPRQDIHQCTEEPGQPQTVWGKKGCISIVAAALGKVAYVVEGGPKDLLAVAEVAAPDDRQRHE